MKSVAIWIEASRPKTLICSLTPILIGTAFAWKSGHFSPATFFVTLLTGVAIQILTNLANDYFDFIKKTDRNDRKGPRRVTQAGVVSLKEMRRALFIVTLGITLLTIYLIVIGGAWIAAIAALSILLAFGYTGGPFPLAYLGLSELFVLIFFGPVATGGTYYLQTHHFSWPVTLLGLAPALMATAILCLNNLRDIEEDRRGHKKTLCVRFGKTFGRWEYTACLIGGCTLPAYTDHFLPLVTLIPAIIPLKAVWTIHDHFQLNIPFAQTGKLMILFTILICWSILAV